MCKHVVHITTVHDPYDTRIYHKECRSLHKAGYRVTLIAPMTEECSHSQDGIHLVPIKKHRNRFLRMILSTTQAYKIARQLNADYYHIHDPELLPAARLLKRKHNVVIYDIHEDYVTAIMQKEYLSRTIRTFIASIYRTVERALSRKMELCLAEKYYKREYPRGQCILNYPVLNDAFMTHSHDPPPANNKLLYTGNVSVERGAHIHAKLPLIAPEVSVHFVGKCPAGLAREMVHLAGDRRNQLFIEGIDRFVPREAIDAKYANERWLAGLALFPPSDHYAQKELTKFFEYMSAGIPIICSDFPVWKHFVETYGCGIAVNPGDASAIKAAIDYLRTYPREAGKMGENGKKAVASSLNWKMEEEKLIQWYDDIWERKSRQQHS